MKEYILNTFKIGMTEKEAKKYFSKEIKKMNIIENDLNKLKPFIGPPLHETYSKLYNFNMDEYYTALAAFHEYYRQTGIFEASYYPHMTDTLEALLKSGKKL